jgi:hypothetical protein
MFFSSVALVTQRLKIGFFNGATRYNWYNMIDFNISSISTNHTRHFPKFMFQLERNISWLVHFGYSLARPSFATVLVLEKLMTTEVPIFTDLKTADIMEGDSKAIGGD